MESGSLHRPVFWTVHIPIIRHHFQKKNGENRSSTFLTQIWAVKNAKMCIRDSCERCEAVLQILVIIVVQCVQCSGCSLYNYVLTLKVCKLLNSGILGNYDHLLIVDIRIAPCIIILTAVNGCLLYTS